MSFFRNDAKKAKFSDSDVSSLRSGLDWSLLSPLRIRARQAASGLYAGAHRSARKGAGIEFGGYRAYTPGDDLRGLDRRSLLRHGHLLVRQFETETDRALHLMVDATASMAYRGAGSQTSKYAWASVVSAALAHVAVGNGDPVSLGFLGGSSASSRTREASAASVIGIPPSHGREAFERICDALETTRATGDAFARGDSLEHAFGALERVAKRGSVVVFLSDLLDLPADAVTRVAALASRGRSVVVLQVLDADETTFPFDQSVFLQATEGNATVETDSSARAAYVAALTALTESWRHALTVRGAGFVSVTTAEDEVRAVRRVLEAVR